MGFLSAVQDGANSAASALRGLLGGLSELDRQRLAQDGKYYQSVSAFFELQDGYSNFLFPLVYAPSQMTLSEPFAVQVTPTLDSSFYVEESGVTTRRLQISGSTGMAPHALPIPIPLTPSRSLLPKNYTDRALQASVQTALSGMKQFQYLNEVFRRYSDMKRDGRLAADAKLIFHLPQSDEHWQVVPMTFQVSRTAQSPFTFPYSIDMLVVGPATPVTFPLSDSDKGWLDTLRDGVSATNQALNNLNGAINDLTAVQGSFRILGGQITGVIDSASYIAIAGQNFLAGTSALINVPLGAVSALFNLCTQTLGVYTSIRALGNQLADWPRVIVQRFRAMQSACDTLLSHPELFAAPVDTRLATLSAGNRQVVAGGNVVNAISFGDIQRAGSANLPGDGSIAAAQAANTPLPTFRSTTTYAVRQNDTLLGIAQKQMGDSTLWPALALYNDIAPPIVSAQGRSYSRLSDAAADTGILVPGRIMLIPSTQAPASATANPSVLGELPTAPPAQRLLGRDLALVPSPSPNASGLFDLAVDQLGHLATVAGAPALAQGVTAQVTQLRGSCPLYPNVGLEAVVGSGLADADLQMLRFRVQAALERDGRVKAVRNLEVTVDADKTIITADIVAAGLEGSVPISIAA